MERKIILAGIAILLAAQSELAAAQKTQSHAAARYSVAISAAPRETKAGSELKVRGIEPGEVLDDSIDLNKLFILKPGKYTVQVERLDDESNVLVKSNKVTLTVSK